MGDLTLYRDSDSGSFSVSNYFIDEYLADANDAQIKVYLYLVRMMNGGRSTNIGDMADKFNHTEKDICRALRYWEKMGVMSLNQDRSGNIVAIQFHDISLRQVSGIDIAAETAPVSVTVTAPVTMTAPATMTNFPVREEAPVTEYVKPSYNAGDLKAFKNKPGTEQLIYVAERYLGRTLSANDIRSLLFFTDVLKFDEDLIDELIQACVERGKTTFSYMDKVAIDWAENNIKTAADARKYLKSNFSDTTGGQAKIRNISTAKANPSKGMETRDYDVEAIEKQLLSL